MRERDLFIEALQKEGPGERAAYLDAACAGDDDVRRGVERLLAEHQRQESFILDTPPPGIATSPEPSAVEAPGTQIGPYKLLEPIGEGGMGVVFMAEQQEPVRRRVALKVIKPGMDTRQVIARFEAERQALAVMDHPNIAKVFDAGETASGRPYFVMELVKGLPITDYCDQAYQTPRERLALFVGVCQAVQHAHQKGIIHRDLKPSNVLVTVQEGRPSIKVIDFGVAKATVGQLTDKTLFTGFAQMIGTPLYMSPEQAGQSVDIDTRSDIYSLGVLLYELLTGTTPFDKKRFREAAFDEICRIIREEEPPKPSTRLSESKDALPSISAVRQTEPVKLTKLVRGELDWIVMKCLEKDRSRRYETANGLALDLQRYLADEPVVACPPSRVYRLRKFVRRNRVAVAMIAIVVVALGVVGAVVTLAYRNEQQRLAEQKAHEERLLAEQRQFALEKSLMMAISGDFDGAEKAIDQAELLGASTAEVRMLRGQVAFHRGEIGKAIEHLEQSRKLLPVGQPGAVAARAMLALAYSHHPFGTRIEEVLREIEGVSPITPGDFLFKGQVESMVHPGRGLQMLDEAIRRRDSLVARVARTEARANRAVFTSEVRDAELAIEDAQVAKGMLPDNPLVLARSVFAHLVAASIYEAKRQPEDRKRVLARARTHVKELERFPSLPLAANSRFEYFVYIGDDETAYQLSEGGTQFGLVALLYRRGEFAKALEAAERIQDRGAFAFIDRAFVLAELGPDGPARALAAFREATAKAGRFTIGQMTLPTILLFLGQPTEAQEAVVRIRKDQLQTPPWWDGWYHKRLDFECGLMTADEMVQAAGTCRPKLCEAHFSIGLHRLADGDRAGARVHFRKCVDTRLFTWNWDYPWACAFLARMDESPAWPPWIPMKK